MVKTWLWGYARGPAMLNEARKGGLSGAEAW
jgi:hypothetical protein